VFNVGTGNQTTLRELVETVREQLSVRVEPDWGTMPDRAWDTDVWICDPTLIGESVGWKPARGLEEDLRRFADWMRSDRAILSHYETARSLPR